MWVLDYHHPQVGTLKPLFAFRLLLQPRARSAVVLSGWRSGTKSRWLARLSRFRFVACGVRRPGQLRREKRGRDTRQPVGSQPPTERFGNISKFKTAWLVTW
jgi:hypothetical protein